MQSRDGRWWVTYNGELYNHHELRQNLLVSFRGHSDTETLVELLAEAGIEAAITKLNGMFAFCAVDTLDGKLYLVRDPFGVKPVYYVQTSEGFSFASEVRALEKMGQYNGDLDTNALDTFLTLRYVPSPDTLWEGVRRLPPGHALCLDIKSGAVNLWRYIEPVGERFSGTLDDAVIAYQKELRAAVERQLLSDVPVGVLLSGGIDSALVAAMAKEAGRNLPCFTVGFGKGYAECEIEDAAETANVLGLSCSAVEVNPDQLREALPHVVSAVEEPLGTTSVLPMWYLAQRARDDVTVVLTGQGSDEPWGGYRRYQVELLRRLLPWSAFWKVGKFIAGLGPSIPEVLERGFRTLPEQDIARRFVEACTLFPDKDRQLLIGDSAGGSSVKAMSEWLGWLDRCECEPAEQMMRLDARMNLSDDLLLYGDKISMAYSLEARVPMLDVNLVKFVESLPLNFRLALRRTKIVHKQMAEQYLPSAIVHRQKKGFQVPFGSWSRGIWHNWVEEQLLDHGQPHLQVLRREGLERIWREHLIQKPDRSRQIFALLMLAIWWGQQKS